jgi:hypothetical protein
MIVFRMTTFFQTHKLKPADHSVSTSFENLPKDVDATAADAAAATAAATAAAAGTP